MRFRKSPLGQSDPDAGPGREQFPHVLAIHGWYPIPQISIPGQFCKTVLSEPEGNSAQTRAADNPFQRPASYVGGFRVTRTVVMRRDTCILRQTYCQAERSQSESDHSSGRGYSPFRGIAEGALRGTRARDLRWTCVGGVPALRVAIGSLTAIRSEESSPLRQGYGVCPNHTDPREAA